MSLELETTHTVVSIQFCFLKPLSLRNLSKIAHRAPRAGKPRDKTASFPDRMPEHFDHISGCRLKCCSSDDAILQPAACTIMTDKTIDLDQRRGMVARKAKDLRRLLADVEANEKALRLRQDELETHLLAAPAANWDEAGEKACYLLNLFAATLAAQNPRKRKLVAAVLADFKRLSGES